MFDAILHQTLVAILFATIGVVMFALALRLIQKIVPFSIAKEIEQDQNIALGIIIGCVMLGLAIIVAAAIH